MNLSDSFELERFKRDINLVEYACERHGYRRDRRESSACCHVLRRDKDDDKIVCGRDTDGHWQYFSVRDGSDNGSIVDFVQHRGASSLGHARAELRAWVGTARPDPGPEVRPLTPSTPRDHLAIGAFVASLPDASTCSYLHARGITPATLSDPRFAGTWKASRNGALFLHRDDHDALTGYEIKASRFTGFAKGGTKTLWSSKELGDSAGLVLTETAVDALSHAQLYHPGAAGSPRYVSTAGAPSSLQLELLDKTMRALPDRSLVVAAFDSDTQGHKYAATIADLAHGHRGRGLRVERRTPPAPFKDWNEQLQRAQRDYIRALPPAVRALAPSQGMSR